MDEGELDEFGVPAASLSLPFSYLFGGDWLIDIDLVGPGLDYAGCIDGSGSVPPEECGGPAGYARLAESGQSLPAFDLNMTDRTIRAATDHSHG